MLSIQAQVPQSLDEQIIHDPMLGIVSSDEEHPILFSIRIILSSHDEVIISYPELYHRILQSLDEYEIISKMQPVVSSHEPMPMHSIAIVLSGMMVLSPLFQRHNQILLSSMQKMVSVSILLP